jgi:hypothetical protein
VRFDPAAQAIHIDAEYQLRNTGNRPIREMEVLFPGNQRLHISPTTTKWDGADISTMASTIYPRNSIIRFADPWPVSAGHSLHISYDILPPAPNTTGLSFASDAFYLPASGWSPQLPQVRGLFGFGGVPPKKWDLVITVPEGFLVHSSGTLKKSSRGNNIQTLRTLQTVDDRYPFVIAGRYVTREIRDAHQKIILWSRAPRNSGAQPANVLQQATGELTRTIDVYNALFGAPASRGAPFWIVECPVPEGCISRFRSSAFALLNQDSPDEPSSELASSDAVMVDVSKGAPKLAAAAAPSLAASWLGYGRNPGFYEQTEPLSLLPIFFAARSREEIDGPRVRGETIRRALRLIPRNIGPWQTGTAPSANAPMARAQAAGAAGDGSTLTPESRQMLRAKSFLFFYGLQDRYGVKVFHDAIAHMLYARASRGFDLDDLIAALEQETHQNVAQFVRLWMKHPGVPEDFRARYENSAADNLQGDFLPHPSHFPVKGATP